MQNPMINGIEVKVGQKWKALDGTVVLVDSTTNNPPYIITGHMDDSAYSWTSCGHYYSTGSDRLDLVELVQDIEQPKAKARVVEETTNGVTIYKLEVLQDSGEHAVIASANHKETLIKEADTYSTIQRKVIHEVF